MTRSNKARSKVRKRNRELAPVGSSSDHAIIGSDLVGIVVGWNKGAQDLYGYTAEEMIGQSITTVIPEHLHGESRQFLADVAAGQRARHETIRMRKNGSLVHVLLIVSPVKNSKGKIIGAST